MAGAKKASGKKASRSKAPKKRSAAKAAPAKRTPRGAGKGAGSTGPGRAVRRSGSGGSASRAPARAKPAVAGKSPAVRREAVLREQLRRTRLGSFEELFEPCPPEIRDVGYRLRAIVFELIPGAQETIYLDLRTALYKRRSEICGIQPAEERCNFLLVKGAYLHDTYGVLEGTSKSLRHVKVRSAVGVEAETIRELLRLAIEIDIP